MIITPTNLPKGDLDKKIDSIIQFVDQISKIVEENISKTMVMNHYLVHLIYLLDKDKIIDKDLLEELVKNSLEEIQKEIELFKKKFKSTMIFSSTHGEA
jgi:RNA processing factor Prp31